MRRLSGERDAQHAGRNSEDWSAALNAVQAEPERSGPSLPHADEMKRADLN
jgi:hypothetical protein